MPTPSTLSFYDAVASAYAEAFHKELEHKPFDRWMLLRFADENMGMGRIGDLGCGPGHTTKFLFDAGLDEILGLDLSPKMVEEAQGLNPGIKFVVGDMLRIAFRKNSFRGLVAFYSIVHFNGQELKTFFLEAARVLQVGGQLLISFHVGTEVNTLDEFLGVKATVQFRFHEVDSVIDLLKETGFALVDAITRYPYEGHEYPSQRAYLLAEKLDPGDPFEKLYAGLV